MRKQQTISQYLFLIFIFALVLLSIGIVFSSRGKDIPMVPETFHTIDWPWGDIDSLALWKSPSNQYQLFITAKKADQIYLCNAKNGALQTTLGKSGTGLGELKFPNGIAVFDHYLFVVERDNHRVQVFDLLSNVSLGTFGADILEKPYGLVIIPSVIKGYEVYVTDGFETPSNDTEADPPVEKIPPEELALLAKRVKQFRVRVQEGNPVSEPVRTFGETHNLAGVLRKVESILVDPENQCLLLCDEITRDIKVYSLDGKFTGRVFGKGIFQGEPEGLVLVRQSETSPEQGYYLIAEQRPFLTLLHLFDRKTYEEKAVFTGNPNLANTDGIAFYQGDFGPFKQGALFCVHDDVRVQAYSWGDVLKTLGQ